MTFLATLLSSIQVSAVATAQLYAIVGAGFAAAAARALDAGARASVAKLNFVLLNPLFVVGLAPSFATLTPASAAPVALFAAAHLGSMFAAGTLAARALRLPAARAAPYALSLAFSNSGGLPFVLFVPLCALWPRLADDATALSRAYGYIVVYIVVWQLALFGFGRAHLRGVADAAGAAGAADEADGGAASLQGGGVARAASGSSQVSSRSSRSSASGRSRRLSISALTVAYVVDDDDADDSYSIRREFRYGAVGGDAEAAGGGDAGGLAGAGAALCALLRDPMVCSLPLAVALGVTPGVARALFGAGGDGRTGVFPAVAWVGGAIAQIGRASVPVSTLLLGGALHETWTTPKTAAPTPRSAAAAARAPAPEWAVVSTALVLRLLVQPLVFFPLTYAAAQVGLLGPQPVDPVLYLLLFVWSGLPASQTLVALAEAELGAGPAATLSSIYVPQYAVSAVTVPLVVAAAILIIGS